MTARLSTRRQMTLRKSRYTAPALEKGLDILELLASVSEALLSFDDITRRHITGFEFRSHE